MVLVERIKEFDKKFVSSFIFSEEYQDKFYLRKTLKEIFPDLPDELIYKAIERCNKKLKPPRRKKDFIKTFVSAVYEIVSLK
ncbi:MAG: CUE domain-containing protein [Ignavibacteria bacterium]|jgi:hypothetical protein